MVEANLPTRRLTAGSTTTAPPPLQDIKSSQFYAFYMDLVRTLTWFQSTPTPSLGSRGILSLEVVSDSEVVSNVSSFTNYITYCDPSDIYTTTRIAALITHHQRTLRTARTARTIHLIRFASESRYSIDHLDALTTLHFTDRGNFIELRKKVTVKKLHCREYCTRRGQRMPC